MGPMEERGLPLNTPSYSNHDSPRKKKTLTKRKVVALFVLFFLIFIWGIGVITLRNHPPQHKHDFEIEEVRREISSVDDDDESVVPPVQNPKVVDSIASGSPTGSPTESPTGSTTAVVTEHSNTAIAVASGSSGTTIHVPAKLAPRSIGTTIHVPAKLAPRSIGAKKKSGKKGVARLGVFNQEVDGGLHLVISHWKELL